MELPGSYADGRDRFIAVAGAAGAELHRYEHPSARGPKGESLTVDVARVGPADADAALVVVSGTHGVEGFAGSACQCAWLESGGAARAVEAVHGTLAVVLVHAINPYGFAWVRRVNEDNVDLNRNCVDFDAPLPDNPRYDELAADLVPETWDDATRDATTMRLVEFAAEHGAAALQAAISAGQYRHPGGIFYGGTAPVWSRAKLEAIVRAQAGHAARAAVVDLHTGLGPRGTGELICSHPPDSGGYRRAASWYGKVTSPSGGTSVSVAVTGDLLDALQHWLPGVEYTGIAIEWGTVSQAEVVHALRADAWLHASGDPSGPDAPPIKEALREAFAPDDPVWTDRVWDRFAEVVEHAVAGVTSASSYA